MLRADTKDTTMIEMDAIDILKNQLKQSLRVFPYINDNDKTPSWDGHLMLTDTPGYSKDGVFVPVQIKGTLVDNFTEGDLKKSVGMQDLKNYRNQCGVLYIVVEVINRWSGKIFYESLLPAEINKYIDGKENQGSVTVTLKELDVSSASSIENCLRIFNREKNWQRPNTIYSDEVFKSDNVEILFDIYNGDFLKSMVDNPITFRGRGTENGKHIDYIEKITPILFETTTKASVSVNGKEYFQEYTFTVNKDKKLMKIGKGITIYPETATANFQCTGTLKERLASYELIFALIEHGDLLVNGNPVVQGFNVDTDISALKKNYKDLCDIQDLLILFNIDKDIEFEKLSERDLKNLYFLIETMLYNVKQEMQNSVGVHVITVGDIGLPVFVSNEKGKIKVDNLFDESFNKNILTIRDKENPEERIQCGIYLMYNKEMMLKSSFVDYDMIFSTMKDIDITNYTYQHVNDYALQFVGIYDETGDKETLEFAISLFQRLLDYTNGNEQDYLNLYQCYRRKRDLKIDEIIKLSEIYKTNKTIENNDVMLWAISVVMNDKEAANLYHGDMKDEEVDHMKQYPIYELYKLMEQ